MLGTWGLHGWVAGAAPGRFCCVYLQLKSCWRGKVGSAVRTPPDSLTLSFAAYLAQRWAEGPRDSRSSSSTPAWAQTPALTPFSKHSAGAASRTLHTFETQWSGVTFLLLFLEKYSFRRNCPSFPQAAKHSKQAETFFLNASGGWGFSSLVLVQRLWINGYGITIRKQRIITGFLLLCDNLHCILGSFSTSAQFCSWMLGVCVLGIKFFCLEHFSTNHNQICDCIRAVNCLLLWKALSLWGA